MPLRDDQRELAQKVLMAVVALCLSALILISFFHDQLSELYGVFLDGMSKSHGAGNRPNENGGNGTFLNPGEPDTNGSGGNLSGSVGSDISPSGNNTQLPQGVAGGGGGGSGQTAPASDGQTATTVDETALRSLTLEIFDVCSGTMTDVLSVSEGVKFCLNQPNPYNIRVDRNGTATEVNYSAGAESLKDSYDINVTVPDEGYRLVYLYVKDIATVSTMIQSFEIRQFPGGIPVEDMYLGDYHLQTISYLNPSTGVWETNMVAGLPLYLAQGGQDTGGWDELRLYLEIPGYEYYLGKVYVSVLSS
jgi:hypothetical protein